MIPCMMQMHLKMMVIVVERANARRVSGYLNDRGCPFHAAMLGLGTAPDEVSALLGLGEPEKAVLTLLVFEDKCAELIAALKADLEFGAGGGIAFTIPVSSIAGRKTMEFMTKQPENIKG